jgi:hypothetical protein
MAQFGLQYAWRECLQHLLGFLSSLPSAQARLVPNLQAKLSLAFNKNNNNMYMPPHSPSSHHSSPIAMQQAFMTYPPQGMQPLPQALPYGHHHHQHQMNGTGQVTMYQPVNIPAVSSGEQQHPGSQASRIDYYYHAMNEH